MITEIKIYPETNSVQVISTEGAVQFTTAPEDLTTILAQCQDKLDSVLASGAEEEE